MTLRLNKPDYAKMNLLVFQEEFRKEEDCRAWLFKTRWADGFKCPNCGNNSYTLLEARKLYMCSGCRHRHL
ncbi:MAG TPA: IS1595 family transposase [Nitrospirae bacterium]|nr:IS1595 family transposase [Nitrospirota bacterium]